MATALDRGDCPEARRLALRLQQETIATIGRVPRRLVENLQGGVNVLVDDIRCATATVPAAEQPPGDGHGKKGHGKHGKHDGRDEGD